MDDFAVFILTHGRPNSVKTIKTLKKCGYTGKVFIVIDDEDETVTFETTYGAVSQRHINVLNFTKQGTTIDFVETRGSKVYVRYNLDLVSSVLIEMTMSRREAGDKEILGFKFLCTKTKPLF